MSNGFAQFCGGQFWNESLLIDNTWPQFTDCFSNTLLTWLPCAVLFLFLPYHVTSVRDNAAKCHRALSFLTGSKLVCCVLLAVTALTQLTDKLTGSHQWSTAAYLGDGIWAACYVTVGFMTHVERIYGVQGQGLPFFFWLLSLLSSVVRIYTHAILQFQEDNLLLFSTVIITAVLQLFSLILTFFGDDHSYITKGKGDKAPCPETKCSFPSFLVFWWMTRLILTGFRRDLKESDLWQLNRNEQSHIVAPVFNAFWQAEIDKNHHDRDQSSSLDKANSESTEDTPLLNDKEESTSVQPKQGSLLRVLGKMLWFDLLVAFLLKVISDLVFFLSPVLLNALLTTLSDRNSAGRKWQSYVICLGLFLSTSVKAVFFGHSLFRATRIGVRIKSVLISAIYAKVLKMNTLTRSNVAAGEILNMMSVDTQQIMERIDAIFYGITTPLQICVAVALLYQIIDWSVLVGVGVLMLQVPLSAFLAKKQKKYREDNLHYKDSRVKLYNEVLNGIKVLKLFAWEPLFRRKIREIREKELDILFKLVNINTVMGLVWDMAPYLVMLATFVTFILSDRTNQMTATEAFVSLAFFNILRTPLNNFASVIVFTIQSWVSIQRINNFLIQEDLDPYVVTHDQNADSAIIISEGTFTWGRHKSCLTDINLRVGKGQLVAVVGAVGCGKSSLISAILGEMEKVSGTVNTLGSIAYVPQQAWILNATVRDNILFSKPFMRSKYQAVVQQCQLERDLRILPAGDNTEIGEKGINLSGGQKQRVSMARAVYSDRDVYLLDDPLSAVDAHVGKAIFSNVIGPHGVLKHKTRVLVTHGVHWLPMVDEIVVIHEGKISDRGSYEELISHDGPFARFLKTYLTQAAQDEDQDVEIAGIHKEMLDRLESSVEISNDDLSISFASGSYVFKKRLEAEKSMGESLSQTLLSTIKQDDEDDTGRLTSKEKVETGKVAGRVFLVYVKSAGTCLLLLAFLTYGAFQGLAVTANFLLDTWSNDPALNISNVGTEDFNLQNDYYLMIYGVYGIAQVCCLIVFHWIFWTRMVHAAREMHARLANRLLHYPMSFFDTTPVGRILNRVSRDVETVDSFLPLVVHDCLVHSSLVLVTCIVIMIETPLSGVILLPTMILYYLCQKFYIPTSRQLKRIQAVSRTPVYVLLCETLSGTASIRAYEAVDRFTDSCKTLVDNNQVYFFAEQAAVRWLQCNLDFLASVVIFAAAVFEIASPAGTTSQVGLSVSYALQLSGTMIWMTRDVSDLETNIVSVERLKEYSELKTEAEWIIPHKRPPSAWPHGGEVIFNNYQTRYRPGLDLVLRGLTLTIQAGEKVGIVGRTGAGKSSLTLSLFRLIEATGGSIRIDGINIADMGLHDLRSRLTILPQDPVLFSGTLRMNLDPFREYHDRQLWTAIERAHLRSTVDQLAGGLYFDCGDEGSNLSVGQRQLVCLARTLLRRTKILVLDEATAAVDMETDNLIQNTIRSAFITCTVITIAHRLHTVMDYDRIVVMEAGEVKECASPQDLLADTTSVFYALAKDSRLVA